MKQKYANSIHTNPTTPKPLKLQLGFFMLLCLFFVNIAKAQISVVNSQTNTSSTTTVTITIPTGLAVGDLMIANLTQRNSENDATLAGWTKRISYEVGSNNRWATILYKVADASDVVASNFTFTFPAGTGSTAGGITAFRGVNTTTTGGIEFTGGLATGNNVPGPIAPTQISTSTNNALVLFLGQISGSGITFSDNGWTLGGTAMTQAYTIYHPTAQPSAGLAYLAKETAGATGAGSEAISASARWGGILLSLKSSKYFRSKATGNWSETGTWEESINNTNWVNASSIPDAGDISVTVRNGHTVTLTGATTAPNLTINSGGILSTGANSLTLGNSTTLTVDLGATLNAGTSVISFSTSGTATINGLFQTANTTGFSGAAGTALSSTIAPTIALGANSTVDYNAAGNQTVTTRTYANLTLSGGGVKTIGTALNGSLATGILNINQTSGAPTASVTNANIGVNQLMFNGATQVSGSWGYGTANPLPTNKSTTYFANTSGYLNSSVGCSIALTSAAGSNAQTVCINSSITNITYTTTAATGATISGLPTVVTGSWANNVVTISGTPPVSGVSPYTYTITLTGGGCSNTATGSITVNQPSAAPTSITGTTTICNGSSITLTAVGGTLGTGANYQWGTGSVEGTSPLSGQTFPTLTVSPTSTTTYWVRIENTTSPCTANTSGVSKLVTVNQPSIAPTSITGITTICNGNVATLTVAGGTLGTGANYQWGIGAVVGTNPLSGQTAATLTVSPTSTTTYWVRIENTTGPCPVTTDGVTQVVTVNPLPQGSLTANGPFCVTGAGQLTWTATAGTGPCTVIYNDGVGASKTVSNVESGISFATVTTPVTATTTYTLFSVTAGTCIRTTGFTGGSATITVNPLPVVAAIAGGSATVCVNSATPAFTDATVGGVWSITAGTGTASITGGGVVTGITAGEVTVVYTVTSGGCTNTVTKGLTVNPLPVVAAIAGGAATVCASSTTPAFTDATNGGVWSIIAGTGTASITGGGVVTGITAGEVTVVYTLTSGGCTNTATTELTVNSLPTNIAITAVGGITENSTTVCAGGSITLSVGIWTAYSWSTGETVSTSTVIASSTTISATASGRYYVQVTDANGCKNLFNDVISSFRTVTVNPTSVGGTATPTASTVCSGSGTAISVAGNTGTIQWQQSANGSTGWANVTVGNGATAANYTTPNLTITTYYRALVTSGVCPSANSATATVTVSPVSVGGTATATASTVCSGSGTTITVTGYTGTIDKWQSSSDSTFSGTYADISYSQPSLTVMNLNATTYYRAVIRNATCALAGSTPATVTVNALPTAPTIGSKTDISCTSNTGAVTLSGLPSTGTWTINPGTISGTGTSYTVTGLAAGNNTFTVTDGNGCSSVASANVTILDASSTTWNGTSWSNGPPHATKSAIIASGSGSPFAANITACALTINNGIVVTVPSGVTLTITNAVTTNGQLIFENNASLVQTNDAAINSGSILYKRTTSTLSNNYDFVYWSSPLAAQEIGKIWMASNWADTFYNFSPAGNNWARTYAANTMTPGKGYIARARNGQQGWDYNNNVSTFTVGGNWTAKFYGVPNNGTIPVIDCFVDNYCLLGNPYPSAIDADKFLAQNTAVLEGTLYFWTHNTPLANNAYNSDDYASYNGVGGTGTTRKSISTGSNDSVPSGKIAAGQGFFAKATATANVTFNNSMRVGDGGTPLVNTQFFRTSNTKAKTANSIEKHRVWLNISNTQGVFKQTLVGYVTDATNGYDSRFDGESMNGNTYTDFYSINENKNLTIQGRAVPFDENDTVPLGFKTKIAGSFTIDIDEVDGLLTNQAVYLEDKVTNTIFNLKNGNYTFTTDKGTFNDRFVLRYTDKTLGTAAVEKPANQILVTIQNKQIKITSLAEPIEKVFVYDVSGKQCYQKIAVNSSELLITTLAPNHQILVVKTVLQNGKSSTKKVLF
jgi:hypothetical protein